jgi:hypothetical protein
MNKETLELVKKMVEEGNLPQEIAEKYCPELKESEDERIRKFICGIIDNLEPKDFVGVKKMDVLRWLEKQKEQKPSSLTKYVYSKEDKRFIQDCANILIANDYAISAERLLSMFEQKPAEWSEEDENALKYIHELISYGYSMKFMDAQTAHDMREWVNKSLRTQPHWKPSEEQMKALKRTILLANFGAEKERQDAMSSLYDNLLKLKQP